MSILLGPRKFTAIDRMVTELAQKEFSDRLDILREIPQKLAPAHTRKAIDISDRVRDYTAKNRILLPLDVDEEIIDMDGTELRYTTVNAHKAIDELVQLAMAGDIAPHHAERLLEMLLPFSKKQKKMDKALHEYFDCKERLLDKTMLEYNGEFSGAEDLYISILGEEGLYKSRLNALEGHVEDPVKTRLISPSDDLMVAYAGRLMPVEVAKHVAENVFFSYAIENPDCPLPYENFLDGLDGCRDCPPGNPRRDCPGVRLGCGSNPIGQKGPNGNGGFLN